MLKFLNINIEGFCSIKEPLYLSFDQNQIVWIKAPNGSGKSSIFSAMVWCLYGKTIKGVSDVQTWKEYRGKDYNGCCVSVRFQKGDNIYQVIRCQKYEKILDDGSKGKDRLLFLKDAECLNIKGKTQLQQNIIDVLGLTQSLFTNSIMFGQGLSRLIQESNADKKKLFEEVFDLNYLNIARGIALEDKNNILSQINAIESESLSLKRELDSNISMYKELRAKEKYFSDHIRSQRKELREDRKKLLNRKAEAERNLGASTSSEITKLKSRESELQSMYRSAKEISNIPIKDFIKDVCNLIENKQYKKALKNLQKISTAFNTMDEVSEQISDIKEQIDKLRISESNYNKYKTLLENIEEDLEDVKNRLSELKNEKLEVISPSYKAKIKDIQKKLRKVDEDYHNKELELKDYDWLINDPLSNNGIKAYLFDSSLDFLNHELERYSSILGFRITFDIDLATTRKEFVTLIERDDHIIEYDELSGGEKQLVDLSMALAMNQALTVSKGINIAFLDEVFESLSSDNIELVVQLVKQVYDGKTLFLISHQDSLPFSNIKTIEVEKRQGLSYYKRL